MKAIILNENGGLDKLIYKTDFPKPEIKPDEVLVNVKSTSVNRVDLLIRNGYPGLTLNFPHIEGGDVAGVVEKTGWEVKNFEKGDRVVVWPVAACGNCEWCRKGRGGLCLNWRYFGMHRWGGYAEYIAVPEGSLLRIPDNVSFEEAACFPVAGLPAYHGVVSVANLQPGETFFIWGGTSGLGSVAIQLAQNIGCKVFATAGKPEKIEKLKDMGVEHVFNHYEEDNIAEQVLERTGNHGVDVVLDYVGPATHPKSFKMVKKGGKILWCGIMTGTETTVSIHQTYLRHLSLLGVYLGEKHELESLLKLCSEGKLKPVIGEQFDLKDAARGQQMLAEGKVIGKVILNM